MKSLDEKLDVVMAGPATRTRWLTDRGLMMGGGSDGPAGIRGGYGVTAFPAPLTFAASFDPRLAARYGDLLGQEVHAWGNSTIIGPAMDMTRTWRFGRSVESYGEDPFLAAEMAGAEVAAIQKNHVITMIKHYAVYTQEQGRAGDAPQGSGPAINHILDERTLREIYLPTFEAAVKAGAGSVMCSFPRVNGTYACENPHLLGILKNEWGFDGTVGPDFPDAQRSIVAAVNAGLDVGTMLGIPAKNPPSADRDVTFAGEDLRRAVKEGKVAPARIDDMLMRRLVPAFRLGVFDVPAKRLAADITTPERRTAAADIVTSGTVLLKNADGILPFGPDVKSIALIGAQAGPTPVVTEMGSANVRLAHLQPVLPALAARAGSAVKIDYAPGTLGLQRLDLLPTSYVRAPDGAAGFRAEYFANAVMDFSGPPLTTRVEGVINVAALPGDIAGLPPFKRWSTRWTGTFTAPAAGVQHFALHGSGSGRFFVNDKLIGSWSNDDMGDVVYANVPMEMGAAARLRIEWTPRVTLRETAVEDWGNLYGPVVRLGWAAPDNRLAEAVAAARKADVAVVFVGQKVGEGMDRTHLSLDNDQDALIEAVAAANPRTVVVLNTGGAVTMPWLEKVAAVMEMWLPGDVQGPAAARLLFGDDDPGGRLPVTFPRDETQGPAQEASQYPGTIHPEGYVDETRFDEKLLIGYRWWDAKGEQPLFPFGYGLSYTRFRQQDISVNRTRNGGATVKLTVRNIGARKGTQVVQAYLGFPAAFGEPTRQLKGMARVALGAGRSAPVTITLPPSAFRYWDEKRRGWAAAHGTFTVSVGTSSRDFDFVGSVKM